MPVGATEEQGFTMVEMLVAIALLAVCLSSILPTFVAARVSLHESRLRVQASYLLNSFAQQIMDTPFKQIGSRELNLGLNNKDIKGEQLFEYLADEFGATVAKPANYGSLNAAEQAYYGRYIYDITGHVYYNRVNNPHLKYIHIRVQWVPYQRAISPGGGINIRRLDTVVLRDNITGIKN
jgi:prepilin-type N-terminal cleavage/methylation domain-containing protein